MKLQFKAEPRAKAQLNVTVEADLKERYDTARKKADKLKIEFTAMLAGALAKFMDEFEAELKSYGKGQGKASTEVVSLVNGQG